jgi:hypothetical protein
MIINELFDNNTGVQEVSPWSIQRQFSNIHGKIVASYILDVGEDEYVFYFSKSPNDDEGIFSFGYGKAHSKYRERHIGHDLTNEGIPFRIVPAVIQVLHSFLTKHNPKTVSFIGASLRQTEFYKRATSFLAARLPKPYRLTIDDHHVGLVFYITRDGDPQ